MTPAGQRGRRTEPTRLSHVLVGTSGFSYPAWRGTFYPEELSAREMLGFYARQLGTVEINYTFQRFPKPELLTGWGRQTPAGFRFALKAPQRITHQLRSGNTYSEGLAKSLGENRYEVWTNECNGNPGYLRAILFGGLHRAGAKSLRVSVLSFDGHAATFDVAWQ